MRKFLIKYDKLLAALMLITMFALGFWSMKNDSAIVDEVAHIPAGYSYLHFQDYRLNPEHPPLIKDLAALPLMAMKLRFPTNIAAWSNEPNGQWEVGWNFLYHIGNNANEIIFYSRLPILALGIFFGFSLYIFTKRKFGIETGLLTLFFYCLSPNIIAHAKLVTTDLGIAAFIFFAFWAFLDFIKKPSAKTIFFAGLFLALAQLSKFSAIIIYPLFGFLSLLATFIFKKPDKLSRRMLKYLGGFIIYALISFALIWVAYIPHVAHMPKEVQTNLIAYSLPNEKYHLMIKLLNKLQDLPFGKALTQYLLGLSMVFNRVKSGNTTYFMGNVTNQSFFWYFPVTYLLKTPLSFIILTIASLIYSIYQYFRKTPLKIWHKFSGYVNNHFIEFSFLVFIVVYSYLSITGNLNLGIRHLFPIMPFVFILVSKKIVELIENTKKRKLKIVLSLFLAIILSWYMISTFVSFPKYIAYFNEFIGGGKNADKYFTDSNVDWGQDLTRLKEYVDNHPEIDKIAIDYFGGGDAKYYFCKRKYDENNQLIANASGYDCDSSKYIYWDATKGVYHGKYLAVSETFLFDDIYYARLRGDDGYKWLRGKTPIDKIGDSIYLYKLN